MHLTTLFQLMHFKLRANGTDESDNRRIIGLFSSRAMAAAATARLLRNDGFGDWPFGFRLLVDELDSFQPDQGFVTLLAE